MKFTSNLEGRTQDSTGHVTIRIDAWNPPRLRTAMQGRRVVVDEDGDPVTVEERVSVRIEVEIVDQHGEPIERRAADPSSLSNPVKAKVASLVAAVLAEMDGDIGIPRKALAHKLPPGAPERLRTKINQRHPR
jgi:hypothetical protein